MAGRDGRHGSREAGAGGQELSNVHQFPGPKKPPEPVSLKCIGVCRDKQCPNSLVIITNRPPTDDEMRLVHEGARELVHVAWLANVKEDGE